MHPFFLGVLTGAMILYFVMDRIVLVKSSRFYVYYTALSLLSAGILYFIVHKVI